MRIIKGQGKIIINGKIYRGMISFNRRKSSPCLCGTDTELTLHKQGTIIFNGPAKIGCSCSLNINTGVLYLGKNIEINNQNNIGCFNHIKIGDNTLIGHQNQIYDSNFHHIENLNSGTVYRSNAPITIGKNCWITNRTTILNGVNLPDYTIVGSNSLVNKSITTESHQLIGGIPAKILKKNLSIVSDKGLENKLHFFFRDSNQAFFVKQSYGN